MGEEEEEGYERKKREMFVNHVHILIDIASKERGNSLLAWTIHRPGWFTASIYLVPFISTSKFRYTKLPSYCSISMYYSYKFLHCGSVAHSSNDHQIFLTIIGAPC